MRFQEFGSAGDVPKIYGFVHPLHCTVLTHSLTTEHSYVLTLLTNLTTNLFYDFLHQLERVLVVHLFVCFLQRKLIRFNISKKDLEFAVGSGELSTYLVDAVTSSGILKAKQKLGITFNSDKLGGIDFTNFSKLTMCSA